MKKVRIHFIDGKSTDILQESWESVMNKSRTGIGNLQNIFERRNFEEVFICSFMVSNITFVEPIKEDENDFTPDSNLSHIPGGQ